MGSHGTQRREPKGQLNSGQCTGIGYARATHRTKHPLKVAQPVTEPILLSCLPIPCRFLLTGGGLLRVVSYKQQRLILADKEQEFFKKILPGKNHQWVLKSEGKMFLKIRVLTVDY